MTVVVRFAPSPTGLLHAGNARAAVFNWLYARKTGGRFILRLEDTDKERSKAEYSDAIMEDLRWLGLDWDEGPDIGGPSGPYRQSERMGIYAERVKALLEKGQAYRCFCTEEELEARRKAALSSGRPPRYDNRCRDLSPEKVAEFERAGRRGAIRFKIGRTGKVGFDDFVRGRVETETESLGDFVIVRSDGIPSFHLAVVIDDALMGVTHVIRGEDHLSNTFLHVLLFEALGFKPPAYAHFSLTLGKGGGLLSKREGAFSIRDFREAGYQPEALANYLALLGWSFRGKREVFELSEAAVEFSLEGLSKAPSVFDTTKLDWIACGRMKALAAGEIVRRAEKAGLRKDLKIDGARIHALIDDVKGGTPTLKALWAEVDAVLDLPVLSDEVKAAMADPLAGGVLEALVRRMAGGGVGGGVEFEKAVAESAVEGGSGKKAMAFRSVRLALTGRMKGPGVGSVADALGADECLARLKRGISAIKP